MLVAAQAVANNANLLFGRILLPRPPAGRRGGGSGGAAIREQSSVKFPGLGRGRSGAAGAAFCWWRRYASDIGCAASASLDKDSIKPPPTIDPIQQLLDEIDERSRS